MKSWALASWAASTTSIGVAFAFPCLCQRSKVHRNIVRQARVQFANKMCANACGAPTISTTYVAKEEASCGGKREAELLRRNERVASQIGSALDVFEDGARQQRRLLAHKPDSPAEPRNVVALDGSAWLCSRVLLDQRSEF
jgi:hypothetical protein